MSFSIFLSAWVIFFVIILVIQARSIIKNKGNFPINVYGFESAFKNYVLTAIICSLITVILLVMTTIRKKNGVLLGIWIVIPFVLQDVILKQLKRK